jgi:hypothetical protein
MSIHVELEKNGNTKESEEEIQGYDFGVDRKLVIAAQIYNF